MRFAINRIIAGQTQRSKRYPTKNTLFDIFNLANQLYRSKSTNLNRPGHEKIYFLENHVFNLLIQGKKHIHFNIYSYNELIEEHLLQLPISEEEVIQFCQKLDIQEVDGWNKNVNKLFSQVRNETFIISDLSKLYL